MLKIELTVDNEYTDHRQFRILVQDLVGLFQDVPYDVKSLILHQEADTIEAILDTHK